MIFISAVLNNFIMKRLKVKSCDLISDRVMPRLHQRNMLRGNKQHVAGDDDDGLKARHR